MKLDKTKKIIGKKIALLICLAMICTLPNIGKLINKNVNANSNTRSLTSDELQDPNKIYVLEIAPGDIFNLADGDNTSSDGTIVHVDRMDMPSYVSKVDEVAGKYDVVIISNKTKGLSTSFSPYEVYRTYTNPYTDNIKVAKYLSDNWGTAGITINSNSYIKLKDDRKYYVEEYYTENDITARRAKPIVDMINNGQNVYIDEDIVSTSSSLKKTKLYQIFTGQYNGLDDGSYKGLGNGVENKILKFDSSSYDTSSSDRTKLLDKIVSEYKTNDIINNRPKINSGSVPADEAKKADGSITNNRDMQFLLNINVEENRKFKLKLYLDMNNDALYKESELFNEIECIGIGDYKDYSISLQLNNNFIGYLGYKIDVVKLDNSGNEIVKNSIESHTLFKAQRNKKVINVLQLYPNSETAPYWDFDDNNNRKDPYTILNKSSYFNSSIENLEDYQINMTNMKIKKFEELCETTYCGEEGIKKLENDYNMIIIGFADRYNGADLSDDNAIEAVKQFIADGYSVMFTHDTISYHLNENYSDDGTREMSRNFRDFVGQARYIDPCRYNSSTGSFDNTNLYKSYNPKTEEYEIKTIPHEVCNTSGKYSLGVAAVVADTNQVKGASTGSDLYKQTYTRYVKNINKGQITSYPYELSENKSDTKDDKNYIYPESGGINVGLTHTQWFQINLEDEDVVPWYNILGRQSYPDGRGFSNINSGDSRNFYYTYSKANITYSGTGHSGVSDTEQEIKLFVNTIIKAERGGNHPPEIDNYTETIDSDNNSTLNEIKDKVDGKIESEKDFEFISIPIDEDQDRVRVSFSARNSKTGEVFDNIEAIDVNTNKIITSSDKINTGTKIKVKIPKENYCGEKAVDSFEVTTTVKDLIGAESTKTFTVNVNHNPTIKSKVVKDDQLGEDIIDSVEVSRKDDYIFAVIPNDIDTEDKDKLKVSISAQCEGKDIQFETKIKNTENKLENFDLSNNISSDTLIFITIKKEDLNKLSKDKGIDIKATVKDPLDASGEDSFVINISNVPPEIENKKYESNEDSAIIESYNDESIAKNKAISVDRTKQFRFVSILKDEDNDKINVSATAYGENVDPINCFINISTEQCDNKTTEMEVDSGTTINVTIPQSFLQKFIPGEYVRVDVKATDKYGGETIKGFYLKINIIDPSVEHGVLESEDNNGKITITPNQKEVLAYSTVNFAGKVNQLFDPSATLELTVDEGIRIDGKVEVYRLVNGKKYGSWEMTKVADKTNVYSLTLSPTEVLSYNKIENGGMEFIVKYTGELRIRKKNDSKYTNTLSVSGINKDVIIIPKKEDGNMKLF